VVAGRRLGQGGRPLLTPYLASASDDLGEAPLTDLEVPDPLDAEADRTALDFALTAADADARWGHYSSALEWLDAAQEAAIVLPAEYADKRREWESGAAGNGFSS
jgi:hypothetical protein